MTGFTEELVLERSALKQENAALRALLAECREHVIEGRDRALRHEAYYAGYPSRVARAKSEGAACDALLDRIDAAVQEVMK